MTGAMEDNVKVIEELLGKVADYGKTELQLAKLKVLDKTSDAVSTVVPQLIVIVLALIFMLFVNLHCLLAEVSLVISIMVFAVAAFMGSQLLFTSVMHKWLKGR
jgi:hypothetical protein